MNLSSIEAVEVMTVIGVQPGALRGLFWMKTNGGYERPFSRSVDPRPPVGSYVALKKGRAVRFGTLERRTADHNGAPLFHLRFGEEREYRECGLGMNPDSEEVIPLKPATSLERLSVVRADGTILVVSSWIKGVVQIGDAVLVEGQKQAISLHSDPLPGHRAVAINPYNGRVMVRLPSSGELRMVLLSPKVKLFLGTVLSDHNVMLDFTCSVITHVLE